MHPEQIKADIRIQGTTPAAIADKLKLSRMTVSNVIHARITSKRVANEIARIVKKPATELWPGRYDKKRVNGLRRGAK